MTDDECEWQAAVVLDASYANCKIDSRTDSRKCQHATLRREIDCENLLSSVSEMHDRKSSILMAGVYIL